MSKQFGWKNVLIYGLVIMLIVLFALCMMVRVVYAQGDCVQVAHLPDVHDYSVSYTDPDGRTICKLILHLHRQNPGDPQEHIVFNGSGEKQGYMAEFNGAHVSAQRTTNDKFISNADVFAIEAQPTDTPTDATPPTATNTPTGIPPVPSDTPAPGTGTSIPPYPPPVVTNTPLPPTLIPPVTNQPPGEQPPDKVRTPAPVLPETGFAGTAESSWPLCLGVAMLLILIVAVIRGYKKG